MPVIRKLIRFARKSPDEKARTVRRIVNNIRYKIPHYRVVRREHDRTAYIIGLFGTGRWYLNDLIRHNIGERGAYFRDGIRCHRFPTSMIYSGHATLRHISGRQAEPETTRLVLDSVRAGFADLIFLYRHPVDSLLTNWVWWRTYLHCNHRMISGISEIYKTSDALCADLERKFSEFEAFSRGDPNFFSNFRGKRFLSFEEFVEETSLHIQSASLALRLEDFMGDPLKEFSRIAEVMSVDLDAGRLCLPRPRTKPYGYLVVREKLPVFQRFLAELDAETKRGIEQIGYDVSL